MIDFHCHLDLFQNARKIAGKTVEFNKFTLVVTTSPKAWKATSLVFKEHKPNIEVALGLHPEILAQKIDELSYMLDFISQTRFVGEVGIDGSHRYSHTLDLQIEVFRKVLVQCENCGGKILSIHSRNASRIVLELLEENSSKSTPVLHWFSGTKTELERAIDNGYWFSVGPAMFQSPNGLKLLKNIPIERILPESDGPFAKVNNKPVYPWEMMSMLELLSELRGKSYFTLKEQISKNLECVLSYN